MQSALDFAQTIDADICEGGETVALIRARDREIIEACKKAIESIKPEVGEGLGSDTRRALGFVYDEAIRSIDSVLRDLG